MEQFELQEAIETLDAVRNLTRLSRHERDAVGLKGLNDTDVQTLEILKNQFGSGNVGEIQRQLGILPAQMSRIIRKLEVKSREFIKSALDPKDKRKITISLTPNGQKTLENVLARRSKKLEAKDVPENILRIAIEKLDELRDALAKKNGNERHAN